MHKDVVDVGGNGVVVRGELIENERGWTEEETMQMDTSSKINITEHKFLRSV